MAEVDEPIDRIDIESDRDQRRAPWRRLREITFRANPDFLPKWLKGLTPTPPPEVVRRAGRPPGPETLWVEDWRGD